MPVSRLQRERDEAPASEAVDPDAEVEDRAEEAAAEAEDKARGDER